VNRIQAKNREDFWKFEKFWKLPIRPDRRKVKNDVSHVCFTDRTLLTNASSAIRKRRIRISKERKARARYD
jgi:hypothetical protein